MAYLFRLEAAVLAASMGLLGTLPSCRGQASSKAVACAMPLSGRVVDQADILSTESEAELTNQLAELERQTTDQLVVATTRSLGGYPIEEYSNNLARCWKLGAARRNNGIMLLVAPSERKVRIEVGRGLETTVTDPEAAKVMKDDIIPAFKQGKLEAGTRAGVNAIIAQLVEGAGATSPPANQIRALEVQP